jgi:hypothetical protein
VRITRRFENMIDGSRAVTVSWLFRAAVVYTNPRHTGSSSRKIATWCSHGSRSLHRALSALREIVACVNSFFVRPQPTSVRSLEMMVPSLDRSWPRNSTVVSCVPI